MADLSERELPAADATSAGWTAPGRRVRAWQAKRRKASRAYRIREVLPFFRREIHAWRSTESISPSDRLQLENHLRYALRLEYRRQFAGRRLGLLFRIAIVLSFISYFAVLPFALPRRYWGGGYIDTMFLALIGSLWIFVIGERIVNWIFKYLRGRRIIESNLKVIDSLWVIVPTVASALLFYSAARKSSDPLLVVVLGLLVWIILFAALVGLASVVLAIATNWVRRRYPDALLAAALFRALKYMEFGRDRWPDPDFRARIALELGRASVIARLFLFRNFPNADPVNRLWQVRQANRIADALAKKQRWLITPKRDTYEFLRTALSRSLVAVLSGSWDELAQKEDPEEADSQDGTAGLHGSLGRQALQIFQTGAQGVAIAALPATALWIARNYGVLTTIDPRVSDYLNIGVFIWAVLILALLLDPRLQEKISSVKEVISLVNPLSARKRGE